jgi:hypothetical protein
MRSIRLIAAALFAFLVLPAVSSTAATPPASDLFVVRAAHGSLVPLGGDRFVLELRGVDTQTTWFTDRPVRAAGEHSTAGFVDAWHSLGLDTTPPNAAIALAGGSAEADTLIVELGQPRYDRRARTLRVKVRRLATSTHVESGHERRADARIPRRFGRVSLFVDPAYARSVTVQLTNASAATLVVSYATLTGGSWDNWPVPGTAVAPGESVSYTDSAENVFLSLGGTLMLTPETGGSLTVQWNWPAGSVLTSSISQQSLTGLAASSAEVGMATNQPTVQVTLRNAAAG